jgi:negative elongation factor A
MRDVDTAMWLHNKLSSDDMWSGTNIWSFLTTDVLRNIQDCFHTLDSQVKIKLLMSFLYIPRRSAQEMSSELNDILEIGSGDSDDWVRILSEILRTYPETGSLNIDLENVSPVFAAIVQDIRQICKYHRQWKYLCVSLIATICGLWGFELRNNIGKGTIFMKTRFYQDISQPKTPQLQSSQ